MNEEMKGFWSYFTILVAGAGMNLVGGILGKTALGYILFFVGLALVIAGFIYLFMKKDYFKDGRLKVLILGLVLSLLLGASITLLLNNTFVRPTANASMFGGLSGSTRGAYSFGSNSGTARTFSGNSGQGFSGTFSGRNSTSGTTTSQSGTTSNNFAAARSGSLAAVLLGWLFLAAGAVLLVVTVIRLLTKKVSYAGTRWKVLLLGLLVGAMLSTSTAMLLTHRTRRTFTPGQFSGQQMPNANGTMMPPTDGTLIPSDAQQAQATATPEATVTATPTPAPTATPLPTATATTQVYASLVVCLDYNIQNGENIRTSPSESGTIVGTIPAAGCFTIDGKDSQAPGWYHFASGQNGMGGIQISSYADDNNLWVYNHYFDKDESLLNMLVEVAVPTSK